MFNKHHFHVLFQNAILFLIFFSCKLSHMHYILRLHYSIYTILYVWIYKDSLMQSVLFETAYNLAKLVILFSSTWLEKVGLLYFNSIVIKSTW